MQDTPEFRNHLKSLCALERGPVCDDDSKSTTDDFHEIQRFLQSIERFHEENTGESCAADMEPLVNVTEPMQFKSMDALSNGKTNEPEMIPREAYLKNAKCVDGIFYSIREIKTT